MSAAPHMPAAYDIVGRSDDVERWLAARREGLGASEAWRLFSEPYALWCEKSGLVEPEDLDTVEAVEWGRELEQKILAGFVRRSGIPTEHSGFLLRSREWPWMLATLDGEARDGGIVVPVEAKLVREFRAGEWADGAPPKYQWQVCQQLAVTGAPHGYIAALLGGVRLVWTRIDRDEGMIRTLVKAGTEMWRRVLEGDAPDADGSEATARALRLRFPAHEDGVVLTLDDDAARVAAELDAAKAARSALQEQIDRCEARIKAALGTAERGVLPDGSGFSFKASERAGYTVAPTTVRTLRRTAPRKER